MPVPAPAVMQLAQKAGFSLRITGTRGEMVTPTGAAILAALAEENAVPASFTVKRVGIGAGKKDFDHANILRAMLIESGEETGADFFEAKPVMELQCNIDDATGEELALCREHLLAAGALDAAFQPLYMKKGRPAWLFIVLCRPGEEEMMAKILFSETTAIGVRYSEKKRFAMQRRQKTVQTSYGEVAVKICRYGDMEKVYAEYDSARQVSESARVPLREVMQAAVWAAKEN